MNLYLLEMIISTKNTTVCEPLGVYKDIKLCERYSKEIQEKYKDTNKDVVINILQMNLNGVPSLLVDDYFLKVDNKQDKKLYELYKDDVFEQMVESDGSFSYQIKEKYKNKLEKQISSNYNK